MKEKKCFGMKCKSKTALARVRQHCNYNKLKYRTLGDTVIIYDKPTKQWDDVEELELAECEDKIGNLFYQSPSFFVDIPNKV